MGYILTQDPGNMYFIIFVIASHHRWRGNPVIYARAYARTYRIHWIATVTAFPRDESEYVKTSGSAV